MFYKRKNLNIVDIRNDLHKIIDTIEDQDLLKSTYDLRDMTKSRPGDLWNSLSNHEKEIVLNAEARTKKANGKIRHEEMTQRNDKWLQE
jgi:hypothetical protein